MKESNDRKVCHGVSSGEPHTVHNRKAECKGRGGGQMQRERKGKKRLQRENLPLAERSRSLLRVKKANRHSISICHIFRVSIGIYHFVVIALSKRIRCHVHGNVVVPLGLSKVRSQVPLTVLDFDGS